MVLSILTCFMTVVNISEIAGVGNFEQIMNRTFSLFSNFWRVFMASYHVLYFFDRSLTIFFCLRNVCYR